MLPFVTLIESYVLIYLATCLLIGAFNSFIFKIIIYRYYLLLFYLLFSDCFGSSLFLSSLAFFPRALMTLLSHVFIVSFFSSFSFLFCCSDFYYFVFRISDCSYLHLI